MVRSALPALPLDDLDLLIVENVGNLVCPAEFRIGEDARVMVSSVAEGEDKPLKYPLMFRACELVLVNKIDLLPHVDFDMERFLHHLDAVHPGVEHMLVSARTGEGVDAFRDWLVALPAEARAGMTAARRDADRRATPPWRAACEANERVLRGGGASGSRGSATGWPSASPAAGAWSRSAARRRPARTSATWRSSSSTR